VDIDLDEELRLLATCPDCSGTRQVIDNYGEPELCRFCTAVPRIEEPQ